MSEEWIKGIMEKPKPAPKPSDLANPVGNPGPLPPIQTKSDPRRTTPSPGSFPRIPKNGAAQYRERRAHLCRRLGCDGAVFGLAGAAAFFFAALRASSRASCLAARSFAPASTVAAGVPSRDMRWSWESTARQ